MMRAMRAIILRDLRLALRQGSDIASLLGFFVLAALLFPFGVGPEPDTLARIAVGVVWATALLAGLLSLDRLFAGDFEDGTLDRLVLAPTPLPLLVLAKIAAHWLVTGLPLIVIAPLIAVMLNLPAVGYGPLIAAMLLGTPYLSLIGAVGAALALGARRNPALVPLLILPLALPVLIFGVAAVEASVTGFTARPYFMLLGALTAFGLALGPAVAAYALRQALD